ncbi:MAG: pitrilysin family protein [Mucilaginibacter sp.]
MFLRTLPNGLDILVVEDNSVPLATVMMTFKCGAFTESKKFNGLTSLYQGMLEMGNKDYVNQQDAGYHAGELGMGLKNSSTTEESSSCYFTLPKSNLEAGLNYLNSAVRFAKMDPRELEKGKQIQDEQLKQKESSPYFALTTAMLHHLWGNLYNRKIAIGNHEVILSATNAMMDSIKNRYYYPNNAVLIVGGDVSHNEVFALTEKIYGDWKASNFDPFKNWPIPEFKPLSKIDCFVVESPLSKTPFIEINWQGPDTRGDLPSTYAADVFSYIVNQQSSKLSKALIQSGLAFSVSLGYLTLKHVGPITLYIEPNPLKVKDCMNEVRKQLSLMDNDDYFLQEEIEIAKRALEIKKVRQEEITSDYVHALSFWWASASLDYFIHYNSNLQKVTSADIKSYVKRYIKNKPYCAGLLINPELNKQINAEAFFTANY